MNLKNAKKIAILTPTFNYHSGMDRVAELQAEEFTKKNIDVTVFALQAKIKSKNYKITELGMPKNQFLERLYRLFFFLDFKKMACYKKLKNYDIVISHFYPMNWLAYKAKRHYKKVEYIYWDHGINTAAMLDSVMQKFYMRLFLFFNNITLKNIDEAFSVSRYLSWQLQRESGIKSKVVYNKIDKKKFNKKVRGDRIKKKYDLKDKKVLLFVGRLAPHKGIHLLLKSFNIINKKIPDARLLIVGEPTFKHYFKRLKKIANSNVIFTGFVEDNKLPEYFAASDIYVTASLWEGFNLPAAEAQACNKPVAAFNLGSHPEVVKNGLLVKKGDINEFAQAAIKLLK